MEDPKFLNFTKTPNDPKCIGIIAILANGFVLRYKISPGKTGGYFPNAPSVKMPDDTYKAGHMPESNFLKEQIEDLIKKHVDRELAAPSQQSFGYSAPSVATQSNKFDSSEECPF